MQTRNISSRASSIVVTRDNFVDMPQLSSCLPEMRPVASEPSMIFSEGKMHVLSYHLPGSNRLSKWKLLFTTRQDGYSHLTFFRKLEDQPETILAIKDTRGYIFGAFLTEEWR